jgi:hypothetical protein
MTGVIDLARKREVADDDATSTSKPEGGLACSGQAQRRSFLRHLAQMPECGKQTPVQ